MVRAGVATLTFLLVCGAQAEARTEFCPAAVFYAPAATADAAGRSAGLVFTLGSETPRTIVFATLVADTDGGWYSWDVANLPLTGTIPRVRSAALVADFPAAVFVRHTWVVHARTSGDVFGWQALGEVSCGIPAFGAPAYRPQKPLPVDGLQHVKATPIAPLFSKECAHPFTQATVTHAVQPPFPWFAQRLIGVSYTSEIEVAVGQNDAILDAWIHKSSGIPALDTSALAAARASSFASAISYCQRAEGDYLFRSEFLAQ
ncbi:MAG TPA: hypothetical protein VKR56_01920 [Candidatus Cybelea sp.]|nr:hypothetical protein [Candidatus Cybelea sp.]